MAEDTNPKFFYGYIIVMAAFLATAVIIGTHVTFGVFLSSLLVEFGWTRAMTSGAFTLSMILEGVAGIVAGRLTDRFGPRIVMVGCGFCLGLGYLLMSQISVIWQLYLFLGVMIGTGMSGAIVPLVSTVAKWFVRRRGVMTGIVLAGTSAGIMIIPLLAGRLISAYGWRTSYIVLGIIVLISVILAAQFLRRDPTRMRLLPYGANEVKEESSYQRATGFSLQQAIHTKQLWFLCVMYFIALFCQLSILVHIVIHITGMGFSAASAASILSIIGGASVVGGIMMGNIADRIGYGPSLIICFVLTAITSFWLMVAREMWMLYLVTAIWGFATAGMVALFSPIGAQLFGLNSHGAIFGVVNLTGTIGGATGPVLIGHIFDTTGSYQVAFLICAAASIIGIIPTLLLKLAVGKGELDKRSASLTDG